MMALVSTELLHMKGCFKDNRESFTFEDENEYECEI